MANVFINLPMPAGNGAGAAVDVSSMGKNKTIVVGGSFVGSSIAIEVSNDGGTTFQPIALFTNRGQQKVPVAAEYMRVSVRGRNAAAFSANVDVGSDDSGATFLNFAVPAADGNGTPLDISSLGSFTSIIAGGPFRDATLTIEISEDGVSYAPITTFNNPGGIHSQELTANWARVVVKGRSGNSFPFTPVVSIGAVNAAGGGSGIFGAQYLSASDATRTTTTSSTPQTKVSLATGTRAGTYRVEWSMLVDNTALGSYKIDVDGADLVSDTVEVLPSASARRLVTGFTDLVLDGTSKTLSLQFSDVVGGNTQGCQEARLSIWRLS